MTEAPRLSVIVIVHRMRAQAMNTLYSLCPDYQHKVASKDYEVLVVENESAENLDAAEVTALGENFHYHLRAETEAVGHELARVSHEGLAAERPKRSVRILRFLR